MTRADNNKYVVGTIYVETIECEECVNPQSCADCSGLSDIRESYHKNKYDIDGIEFELFVSEDSELDQLHITTEDRYIDVSWSEVEKRLKCAVPETKYIAEAQP